MVISKRLKRWIFIFILAIIIQIPFIIPQLIYKNHGKSQSTGQVQNGQLINGYKIPYKGDNYKYFSGFSYFILGRAYINQRVYNTLLECYEECKSQCPGIQFNIMDCSREKGGGMYPHRTHQNGLSVDFMTPLVKNKKQKHFYDQIGVFRYLINFDPQGKLKWDKKVSIDFETMAKHMLVLDDAARRNGLKIKKVIFKLNLKDDLFSTKSGKKLKEKGIYFAQHLSETIDNLHDDHYHIDFEIIQ